MIATYQCAVCGETIETVVDESQGDIQRYTEDCQVCCRPNALTIRIVGDDATIESEFEE
jgi:hypothetical protein